MKLTLNEAKHLIEDIESRMEYDALCDYELAILHKVRQAHPLAVAELEIADLRRQYESLGKYNGELYKALEDGLTIKEFQKARQARAGK
jgi:hypothetical protein